MKKNNKKDKRTQREKDLAFYSMCLNAWKDTRMETDKSLLNLSTSAVGLLLTLFITIDVSTIWEAIMYLFSVGAFITTIFITLIIFDKNAEYVEKVIQDNESNKNMECLDRMKKIFFFIGILFALILGIVIGINKINF